MVLVVDLQSQEPDVKLMKILQTIIQDGVSTFLSYRAFSSVFLWIGCSHDTNRHLSELDSPVLLYWICTIFFEYAKLFFMLNLSI